MAKLKLKLKNRSVLNVRSVNMDLSRHLIERLSGMDPSLIVKKYGLSLDDILKYRFPMKSDIIMMMREEYGHNLNTTEIKKYRSDFNSRFEIREGYFIEELPGPVASLFISWAIHHTKTGTIMEMDLDAKAGEMDLLEPEEVEALFSLKTFNRHYKYKTIAVPNTWIAKGFKYRGKFMYYVPEKKPSESLDNSK